MLRWALHHVRMIRYYSATRRRTVWTTAMDIALAGAVAMAWPTVWVADQFYIRTDPTVVVRGKVYQNPAGAFMASVSGDDIPIELVRDSVFYANFEFSIASERRGWPFVTSHRRPEPVLEMEIFSTRQSKQRVDLPSESPVRTAIAAALFNGGHRDEVEVWRGSIPAAQHRIAVWAANGIIWTILLAFWSGTCVSLARLGWLFISAGRHADRHQRHRAGLCTACGYDLRGNQFGERCPECGTLVGE